MTKLFIIALCIVATPSVAQQRTVYGADGRIVTRSTTDTQGTTTIYDARGNVVGRVSENQKRKTEKR